MSRCLSSVLILSLIFVGIPGCNNGGENADSGKKDKPHVAFVTNCIASFWVVAEKGVQKAGKDLDVEVEVHMPPTGAVDEQNRMVQDLLTKGVDGIAISPLDPDNQGRLLKDIADNTNFITQDSDAPDSSRLCYIGMDNYDAGWMCGELIKEALPDGGEIIIFVGRLEQLNAKLRRQGVIDCILGREKDNKRYDEPGKGPLKGNGFTVLDTRTDGDDRSLAKSSAQDAIAKYKNLACMVGLFAYNPPLCLQAVKEADKLDQIKIVAFDEAEETLQGIIDGEMYGTVVQNPFQYGYKSVEVLSALAKGDKSLIPENKFINIPARQIRKDNVEEFWKELKALTGEAEEKSDEDEKE